MPLGQRRVLRLDGAVATVASESAFEAEQVLADAVTSHPEVLPVADLGMGPLVAVAAEFPTDAGPIDLLAVDGTGRLAIVEFKVGPENSDVRKVIAQLLDYGSALWRMPYEELCERARGCRSPGLGGALAAHVAGRLAELNAEAAIQDPHLVAGSAGERPVAGAEVGAGMDESNAGPAFDVAGFEEAVAGCLRDGTFLYVYVARELDVRTERVIRYLAEVPKLALLAVEVDYFRTGDGAILVPRTAFVPSWSGPAGTPGRPQAADLHDAPPKVRELLSRLDEVAGTVGAIRDTTAAQVLYRPWRNASGIGVYVDGRRVEFDLQSFRQRGEDDVADSLLERLAGISGKRPAPIWPSVPPQALLDHWRPTGEQLMIDYLRARQQHRGDVGFSVDRLHRLLAAIPAGRWACYGDVAAAAGTGAMALGQHLRSCPDCPWPHRVLQNSGTIAAGFRPAGSDGENDDQAALLTADGVAVTGGRADPACRLTFTDLRELAAHGERL